MSDSQFYILLFATYFTIGFLIAKQVDEGAAKAVTNCNTLELPANVR